MENILLAVMMLAFFTFGCFVADRFGRFMAENFRGYQETEEISKVPDTMPDSNDHENIICKMINSVIIKTVDRKELRRWDRF